MDSQRTFSSVAGLLFAVSVTATIVCCGSMSATGGMAMPGGWTMSMAWMRMPGHSWGDAAASFIGMWLVMMGAMMLPSLAPMLWRYRQAIGEVNPMRREWLTVIAAAAYFFVWTLFGAFIFPLGVALTAMEMQSPALARAVPLAVGAVVLIAGALQFTPWKTYLLACCRAVPGCGSRCGPRCSNGLPADSRTAWRFGLRLGFYCTMCCAGLTAILLVTGVMDLRAMTAVAAAISLERLTPAGKRVARIVGVVVVGAGLLLIFRTLGGL